MTIPLAVVAGFLPAVSYARTWAPSLGWVGAIAHTGSGLIGYDDQAKKYLGWSQASVAGAGGIAAGFAIHWLAARLGINRMIGRAGIPVLRI